MNTHLFAGRRAIVAGAAAGAILIGVVVFLLWPRPVFHITDAQIGSKHVGDRVQLFANISFNNDGGDADFKWSAATGMVRNDAPASAQLAFVHDLVVSAAATGQADAHPPFPVAAGENRWFTVYGPLLSRADFQRFVDGRYAFYFGARIIARNQWHAQSSVAFCAFNPGGDPVVIHPCPT